MATTAMMIRTARPIFLQRGIIPVANPTINPAIVNKSSSIIWSRRLRHLNKSSSASVGTKATCHPRISPATNLLFSRAVLPPTLFHSSQQYAVVRIYSSQQGGGSPRNRLVSSLGMIGAGGMLLLGKGKYLLGALKLTKFASLGSMLLTVGAYTAFCE